ncbi:MAG: type II secretion system protein [Candidatus Wildermuthbacteria bacterium]|nr:type II secretion system protein [Candidatus Wildermuthbacteria bacterium]
MNFIYRAPRVRNAKGFTLIELLVVIAIIGMLTSVVLVSLGPARSRARDSKRQADIYQIALAMESCFDDAQCGGGQEKYPSPSGSPLAVSSICQTGGTCYINPLPPDPSTSIAYAWLDNSANKTKYCVYATLESQKYAAASQNGTCMQLNTKPTTLDCWTTCP